MAKQRNQSGHFGRDWTRILRQKLWAGPTIWWFSTLFEAKPRPVVYAALPNGFTGKTTDEPHMDMKS